MIPCEKLINVYANKFGTFLTICIAYLAKIEDSGCGTLKCENAAICEKVAKCAKNSTLNVKIYAICEQIKLNVKMRLSKCIKHFDSKCVKIDAIHVQMYMCKLYFDAICEHLILMPS